MRSCGFLREDYALSLHGVGLNIGRQGAARSRPPCPAETLCDMYQPESFSEHFAWSSHGGLFFNDLLPLPYTEAICAW